MRGLVIEGLAWDTSDARQELVQDIDNHIDRIQAAKVKVAPTS